MVMAICFETLKELEVIVNKLEQQAKEGRKFAWQEIPQAILQEKLQIEKLQELAKSQQLSEKELATLQEWKASKVKRNRRKFGKKREIVQLKHFGVVHKLKKDGYSYAEIADYLARYHKIKINPSSIQRYYTEQLKLLQQEQQRQQQMQQNMQQENKGNMQQQGQGGKKWE